MVIPVPYASKDSTHKVPYVTLALIGLNILVFFLTCYLYTEDTSQLLYYNWGSIPAYLYHGEVFNYFFTALTSTFLHSGFFHLLGNMIFLWALGPQVEDDLGHWTYLAFFLVVGCSANLFRFMILPTNLIPSVGASGAISGVIAAYFMLSPRSRLRTFLTVGWIPIPFFAIPGWLLLGAWIGLQVWYGLPAFNQQTIGGTSWLSHLGGVIGGIALIFAVKLFTLPGRIAADRQAREAEKTDEEPLDISL